MRAKVRGAAQGRVHTAQAHDSALKHATGGAVYIDDMPDAPGTLHAALVLSPVAHGRLKHINLSRATTADGVAAILTAGDIPGENDIAPVLRGEHLFAEKLVEYAGQPVAALVADSFEAAWRAAQLVDLVIEPLEPVLTVAEAMKRASFLMAPMTLERGNAHQALAEAPQRLSGTLHLGGQEHFYLEGQIALAIPDENGDLTVHSSSQNPSEVQHICARLLGVELNRITAVVRRMGGGFGGKESNASWVAGAAAVLASACNRPVKLRLPRAVDMIATGKRHGFEISYDAGFDDEGRILALDAVLAANGGHTADMTGGVLTRALTHIDNCYWLPHVRAVAYACKTNTVSNTAFRGFGGPQGVVVMEDVIEHVARRLGKSPEAVRQVNFYGEGTRDETPYGQRVLDNTIGRCVAQVLRDSEWDRRRQEIESFNRSNPVLKRGLGSFPVKFGISFNAQHLNQAGALVHVYSDGSVRLNHGGTEMGQGLFVKIAQVVAEVFQIDLDRIRLSATSTGEVPNTTPTAASVGSDLNGWAAFDAARTVRGHMEAFAAEYFGVVRSMIVFRDNHVHVDRPGGNQMLEFGELAQLCWLGRVPLSSTGFYKTPEIHWDQAKMKGHPFFYFSCGAAVAEVAVDTLTGETRVLRADLVQDCGRSLNPTIDLGQIEGGFVQGLGWFTCEELWWDGEGRLRTAGPSTYKIPGSRDVPPQFHVRLLEDAPARAGTIFRSKGVGEPPLLLATAVWTAIKDAIGSLSNHTLPVSLDIPATPERVLAVIGQVRKPLEPLQ